MDSNNDYYTAINLKDSASSKDQYYCGHCSRKLFYKEQDKETGKHIWYCSFDNIEYIPDNELVRKKSKFDIPEGSDPDMNRQIPIATIDEPNKELSTTTTYKNHKLTRAYEALSKQGFIFKTYEER